MEKLKAAIIGCGAIFPMHAVSIGLVEKAELVAVCDIKEERAAEKANEFKCMAYTDYKEMIEKEKPDTVHICLPHYLHASVTCYALEHGCDVICEKPMAMNVQEGKMMLECAEKNSRKLSIIFQNRYNDISVALKKEMETGKPGRVLGARSCVNWCRSKEYYSESDWRGRLETEGGGVVVNQAIHTFDLMLWLCGLKAVAVDANISTRAHDIEVEDSAEGIVKFENGAIGSFWYTNYYAYDKPVEVEIKCENAVLKIVDKYAYITYNGEETKIIEPDESKNVSYGNAKGYWGVSHNRQIADFYDYVSEGKKMFVTAEEAFESHRAMCALLQSGREKKIINL